MVNLNTNAFFAFMRERESVRLRKEANQPFPWTEDKILQEYKFTNVRRHHDRTTTVLRESHYSQHRSDDPKTILLNAAIYRYFGTYEFAAAIGWRSFENFKFDEIIQIAADRIPQKKRVFTGAYIITNQGISAPKHQVVINFFIRALYYEISEVVKTVQMTRKWELTADRMSEINGFGGSGFMTKEILLDTMMTDFWSSPGQEPSTYLDGYPLYFPQDYETWTPIGPGGLRGAARVVGHDNPIEKNMKNTEALDIIMELTEAQKKEWPEEYGRLYPTDIQFQLCEFDKYERVRLGQGRPRSKYHQIPSRRRKSA